MKFSPEEHLIRPRDSARERELAKILREQPEQKRFEFIQEYLLHDTAIGLALANACLRDKTYFERLLELGLERADASSIQFWLEVIVSRLGIRRMVALLEKHLNTHGSAVEKALYWLPKPLHGEDQKGLALVQDLRERVRALGLIRGAHQAPDKK